MKSSCAYTPGPWRFDGHGINASDGTRIAKVTNSDPYTYETGQPKRNKCFDATSNLIAAAPDLLLACQYVVEYHRKNDSGEGELFGLDFVTTCIAAINKATKPNEK